MRRVFAAIGRLVLVLVLAHAAIGNAFTVASSIGDPPRTLILSVAPQDGEAFATWSAIPGAQYTLRWKPASASEWQTVNSGSATSRSVMALANRVEYEFEVEAWDAGGSIAVSAPIAVTPRPRPDCMALAYYPWVPRLSFFCTKAALDEYLNELALSPIALKCRQHAVKGWNSDAPDCLYTTPSGEQLLLLRSADTVFAGSNQYPNPADVRRYARYAIWGANDPFGKRSTATWTELQGPLTGNVTKHAQARSFQVTYAEGLSSRITWFAPHTPISRRYGIYHEGHGGTAVDIGADTIDWLLERGWQVIAVDMPLLGANSIDVRTGLRSHGDFESLDGDGVSPLSYFVAPVQSIVDWIVDRTGGQDPNLLIIGRSGGGWTTNLYAALDPRIDVAVSVAGGRPISERLDAPWGAAELGDYEQTAPHLYNAVGHEHLMLAAGSKGSFQIFNRWDPCCFRIEPDSAFVQYLVGASGVVGKQVGVFVDEENGGHSIGPQGYVRLEAYLDEVLRPRLPSPPSGFRIAR